MSLCRYVDMSICRKKAPLKLKKVENERIRIRRVDSTNNANLLGAEKDSVQIDRTGCLICTKGGGQILLNGKEYTIEPNSVTVYFSYSVLHILRREPDLEGIIISCNLETIQPLLNKVSDFNGLFLMRQNPYTKLMRSQIDVFITYINLISHLLTRYEVESQNLQEWQNSPIKEIVRQQIHLLGNSLMLGIVSCYTHFINNNITYNRKDVVLQKFIRQLYSSYRTEHDVSFYAEKQCLTPRYFAAIIKEKTGKAPSEWITAALLSETKRMLNTTSMTVKEISIDLHFPNQSYFGKWFKNLVGCSPLEYKKGNKRSDEGYTEYNVFSEISQIKQK